jgi:hypothetical protein
MRDAKGREIITEIWITEILHNTAEISSKYYYRDIIEVVLYSP